MRILMVEDNEELCEAVSFQLKKEGYTVDVCHDGDDGLHWAKQQAHDLILLDRMLPRMDGLELLGRIRSQGIVTPVLMVTALDGIGDRVDGLDAGADDYLVKPFAIEELLARIRAMGRRPRGWESGSVLHYGDVEFDPMEKVLRGALDSCSLSKRESDLFEVFFKNPAQTLPRSVLLYHVWGPDAGVEEGNLDNYIHFLRRRLKAVGSGLQIKTVRGVGYRLEENQP
ncbi:MAG: response regulator transcription factor [Provencibacterium sp.]|jgi:DNA-binding response OmpR family regulator|nr:response regulator transcription factor [Provencibacterium sp.]